MKACIWCAEQIQEAARICRFCNREQHDPNAEVVLYEGTVPHKVYLGAYIAWGILSLILVGIPFLVAQWLKVRSERWKITNRRIERQSGIFSRKLTVLELFRVKDVTLNETFTDRIFGEGRITVVSSDLSDPTMILRGLPAHRELFDKLSKAVTAARGKLVAVES